MYKEKRRKRNPKKVIDKLPGGSFVTKLVLHAMLTTKALE